MTVSSKHVRIGRRRCIALLLTGLLVVISATAVFVVTSRDSRICGMWSVKNADGSSTEQVFQFYANGGGQMRAIDAPWTKLTWWVDGDTLCICPGAFASNGLMVRLSYMSQKLINRPGSFPGVRLKIHRVSGDCIHVSQHADELPLMLVRLGAEDGLK